MGGEDRRSKQIDQPSFGFQGLGFSDAFVFGV